MPRLMGVLKARPKDRVIVASGVYDMVSLRMAASMGFEALYMTGYGTVASHLGLPDAGLASYADIVGRVETMARMAEAPLIADGGTGYGGLLNVRHAVRGYERAGAAAHPARGPSFAEMNRLMGFRRGMALRPGARRNLSRECRSSDPLSGGRRPRPSGPQGS